MIDEAFLCVAVVGFVYGVGLLVSGKRFSALRMPPDPVDIPRDCVCGQCRATTTEDKQ